MEHALILDRYRPLETLGEGGAGKVVLAFDTRIARRVAIKRLPIPLALRGSKAGLAEARTAALLNHPSIVTVHEWDSDADEAFLIMEHVDGASLADILEEYGPLDLDEAAAVLGPVASALAYAHENGVLHLDIKPENVLVSRDGHVKVADFGVSSLTGPDGAGSSGGGTLGYMPPEQLRDDPLDPRADVWAFAALAFQALTGAVPFASDTVEGSLFRIEVAPHPAPSDFDPSLPERFDDALLAGLAPDSAERTGSVDALAAELLPFLGDPGKGSRKLAENAAALAADDIEAEEEAYEALGLWDRLAYLGPFAVRMSAASISALLVFAGLLGFGVPAAAEAAATAIAAVAGLFMPGAGIGVGLLVLSAGMLNASLWYGVAVLVVSIGFWVLVARFGGGDAVLAISSPLLAVARVPFAAPLLLGFAFPPGVAALAAAFSAAFLMLASAFTNNISPLLRIGSLPATDSLDALATPGVAIGIASWALAAGITSVTCGRATRAGAALGTILGSAALIGGYAAWAAVEAVQPVEEALQSGVLQPLGLSLILVAVVVAAGPPLRGEPEPRANEQ